MAFESRQGGRVALEGVPKGAEESTKGAPREHRGSRREKENLLLINVARR